MTTGSSPLRIRVVLGLAALLAATALLLLAAGSPPAQGPATPPDPPGPDVTAHLRDLGCPSAARYSDPAHRYARNVWAMEAFGGRVYLGHGNSSNLAPAANAGQINAGGRAGTDVWCYDPRCGAFRNEGRLAEEQIARFRVLDGVLTVPGHDGTLPTWKFGAWHRRGPDGVWKSEGDIPDGVHVYDVAVRDKTLFAALGTDGKHPQVAARGPGAETWTPVWVPDPLPKPDTPRPERVYVFARVGDAFLACAGPLAAPPGTPAVGTVLEYTAGRWAVSEKAGRLVVPPGADPHPLNRMERATAFRGATVYLVVRAWNDHQWRPLGLAWAAGLEPGDVHHVTLPPGDAPYDVTAVPGGPLLVLVNRKLSGGRWRVGVRGTTDLKAWAEVAHFTTPAFARSFAALDGDLYFGLGSEVEAEDPKGPAPALPSETGTVLRLPGKHVAGVGQ